MAEREAAIKLTLDDGQYVAAMGKAGDAAVRSAQRSERAMKVFGAGVEKATTNLKALGSTAQSALGLATGLLGGMTFAGAIRGAVELDSKFKSLAFNVSRVTKEQVKAADIQKTVEQAAIATGRRTAEMADLFGELFQATGDAEFTSDMLTKIGVAATATNADVGALAKLADQLHTKFGVASDDMLDLFASMHEIEQGGNSIAEVAGVIDTLGAEMLNAGLQGKRGIDFMIGALAATEDPLGGIGKQVKGIKQILLSLGDTNQIKALAKALHIDPKKLLNEKDLIGRLKRVLGMGKKGADALKASMGEAEEQKALKVLFLDPFEAALKRAQDAGLDTKAATAQALEDLEAHIDQFGQTVSRGSDLVKEASERREDPERRLHAALDQLQRSFSDPKIIKAIEDLSKHLPKIADTFGKFAQFVVKNPVLSGALAVGGNAGMGFVSGAVNEALGDAFKKAFSMGGGKEGKRGRGGRKGVGVVAEGMSELADDIEDGIEAGGKRGASKMASAMRLAAGAALAGLVWEIGKEQIDVTFGDKSEAIGDAAVVGARTASMRGGLGKQREDADALRAAIAKLRSEQGGFVSSLFGAMVHGGGAEVDAMGNPIGTVDASRSGMPDLEGTITQQITDLEQQLKAKEAQIAKLETQEREAIDAQANAKAIAAALKSGVPLNVNVANMPTGSGGLPAKSGGGGSRGVKKPSAMAPGGGY